MITILKPIVKDMRLNHAKKRCFYPLQLCFYSRDDPLIEFCRLLISMNKTYRQIVDILKHRIQLYFSFTVYVFKVLKARE